MREMIHDDIEVVDWPLTNEGDEQFFGYVMAVGVFSADGGGEEGLSRYADFAYSGSYTRYRLPNDMSLVSMLYKMLWNNLGADFSGGGIYGKYWIKRTADGYEYDLP